MPKLTMLLRWLFEPQTENREKPQRQPQTAPSAKIYDFQAFKALSDHKANQPRGIGQAAKARRPSS